MARKITLFCFSLLTTLLVAQPENSAYDDSIPSDSLSLKTITIEVRDLEESELVPFYSVDLSSCHHAVYESNETGRFSMKVPQDFSCYLQISKTGFSNVQLFVDYSTISDHEKVYQIYLSRSPNYYHGRVQANIEGQRNYIPEVYIELIDLKTNETQLVQSDYRGEYSIYLKPEANYKISFSHPDFELHHKRLVTSHAINENILGKTILDPLNERSLSDSKNQLIVQRKLEAERSIYSIQVESTSTVPTDLANYQSELSKYGQVFMHQDHGITKVKVGIFRNRGTTKSALDRIVKETKFSDAFISKMSKEDYDQLFADQYDISADQLSGYAVRLASYLNPTLFNEELVRDIAPVKRLEKDEWTIMMLVGFEDLNSAKKARQQAIEKGFRTAQIVSDPILD